MPSSDGMVERHERNAPPRNRRIKRAPCACSRPCRRRICAGSAPRPRAAEAEGYDGIVAPENQHDPFLALAVAGAATSRIELHTGVAIAFARTPMAVAEVGWDMAGSTGGRFVVGLGSQVRAHNERRFSVAWTPPAPRMREYVQVLRAIWRCWKDGEKPAYEGQHYRFTLMTPNFTPPEPIDGAAAGGDDRRGRPGDAAGSPPRNATGSSCTASAPGNT